METIIAPNDAATLALMTDVWTKLGAVDQKDWKPWSELRRSSSWRSVEAIVGAPSSPLTQIVGDAIQLNQDVNGANTIADVANVQNNAIAVENGCQSLGLPAS